MAALPIGCGSNAVPISRLEFAVLSHDVAVHIFNILRNQWRVLTIDHRHVHKSWIRTRDRAFLWENEHPEYIAFMKSNNALFVHNASAGCYGVIPVVHCDPERKLMPLNFPRLCHRACHRQWTGPMGGIIGGSLITQMTQSHINVFAEGNIHVFRSIDCECHYGVIKGATDSILRQGAYFVDLSASIPGGSQQDFRFYSGVHCPGRNSLILRGKFGENTFAELSLSAEPPEWVMWTPNELMSEYDEPLICDWWSWFDWTTVISAHDRYLLWLWESRFVIYDLCHLTASPKLSTLVLPTKEPMNKLSGYDCRMVIMTDEHRDMLCAAGFVRAFYSRPEMEDKLLPPVYIVEMFAQWMGTQYVHVLIRRSKIHWRVRMVEILQNAAPIELIGRQLGWFNKANDHNIRK